MCRISYIHLATTAVLLSLCHWVNAEFFTAIAELESLLDTQRRVINELDDYNKKEETRLKLLQKQVNQYRREHEKAMKDVPDYLGNPINAYSLIKRLSTDLKSIEDDIKKGTEFNMTISHPDAKFPTADDVKGAAQALTRLQATYKLNVNELSEGMLNGKHSLTHTPMSTKECFDLGKTLYFDADYKNAITWLKEALRKYQEGDNEGYSFNNVDVMEFVAYAHYLAGDVKTALEWTLKLLTLDPAHSRARNNEVSFSATIEKETMSKNTGDVIPEIATENPNDDEYNDWDANDNRTYEALCRGDLEISSEIAKSLKCWYNNKNHAFLKYAPIKVEQVYKQPDMFVFHEVMSENEIELIKSLTLPRFQRSTVYDPSGKSILVPYRISKVTWLADRESPVVERVSQRVSDMTGLSLVTSEDFQVLNYGIGGHYTPHYDFARNEPDSLFAKSLDRFGGNRIATLLFYMSDVAQGGATVFPEIGLSLFPIKGSAAFWWNLHPSGEGDMATKHGACPVLRGSKWAANKWLHLGDQEFRRPCNLEYQAQGFSVTPPRPVLKTSK